jgi:hypothetical protein
VTRYVCSVCDRDTTADDWLTAPHPFDAQETVRGCPWCLAIHTDQEACAFCTRVATCGSPTGDGGYVSTCDEHFGRLA